MTRCSPTSAHLKHRTSDSGVIPRRRKWLRKVTRPLIGILLVASILLGTLDSIGVRAADAPTPVSPGNGTVTTVANFPPLGIPEFVWAPMPGATRYNLQISSDIGFTGGTTSEFLTANARITPPYAGPFSDGIWYWRVRVEEPATSSWSNVILFEKQWASPDNAVQLTAPGPGATLAFFDAPVFSWQPVVGAASYRLQIDKDGEFGATPDYDEVTLATSHQPPLKLANGTYYWRVVPLDPASRAGTPSEVRQFTVKYDQVPQLLEPAHMANPVFTPTLRWTAVRGAQLYRLQYSTHPIFAADVTTIDTRNTTYTPVNDLPNDVNYYWRVRAISGNSLGDWSQVRTFVKRWYLQAQPLTPTNNYQHQGELVFTWTPVPGASYYKFEYNCTNSFPPSCGDTSLTSNTSYVLQQSLLTEPTTWYWRVTPLDRNDNSGKPSAVSSFVITGAAPSLVSPLHFYPPVAGLNPQEDRTMPLPVFRWHRLVLAASQAPAYRIQVDGDPLFHSIDWTLDTENMVAAPTIQSPFVPKVGTDYFWRVRTLDALGGAETGEWSQIWKTRIDLSRQLTPTTTLTLLRPLAGSESITTTPALEWWPLQNADSYEVEIGTDPVFGPATIVDTATVPYAVYTPRRHLRYDGDPANKLAYGTYYWRVRGRQGGTPLGDWSEARRFQVAAETHWRQTRSIGADENRQPIATDPLGDMLDPNYDVTSLSAVQSDAGWFFGFDATTGTTDMDYVLYLDLDHVDGSGAVSDARCLDVTTIAAHRPEYAIYLFQRAGGFALGNVAIYKWESALDAWGTPQTLDYVGGDLAYDATAHYLEVRLPSTAIGMEDRTGSAAVSLFSAPVSECDERGGHAQDTVPSDPAVNYQTPDSSASGTVLSRFTSVSDKLSLAAPPDGDPRSYPSVLPFSWEAPVDVPLVGYDTQAAVDAQFTTLVLDEPGLITTAYTHPSDLAGDNTYYWRTRAVYLDGAYRGAWSQAWEFDRFGSVPQNLKTSFTFATPTFSWDVAEGAKSYELQVDNDPRFGSPEVVQITSRNSYTPVGALPNATYYWRLRIHRYSQGIEVINDWTPSQAFTLTLPAPGNLRHDPPGVVARAPTLCWDSVLESSDGGPVLAAWRYRVQISKEPTFSTLYDQASVEQSCWTPTMGYDDGTYYWRVAMHDGEGNPGDFSPASTFTKQYPIAALISPTSGSIVAGTPTFVWAPTEGAARYRLEVSLNPTFSPVVESMETNNTRHTPSEVYAADNTYYWRVAMVDRDGKQGPFNGAIVILSTYAFKSYLPLVMRE